MHARFGVLRRYETWPILAVTWYGPKNFGPNFEFAAGVTPTADRC
jgi:hypothetical protein